MSANYCCTVLYVHIENDLWVGRRAIFSEFYEVSCVLCFERRESVIVPFNFVPVTLLNDVHAFIASLFATMKENLRPPLPNQRMWRQDDSPKEKPSQRGIDPSSFHKASSKHSLLPLQKALKEASTSVVRQKRREVTTHLKLQRSAYKEVTSLKTWPLQELAMQDFAHWMSLHLGGDCEKGVEAHVAETHGDSTGLSSSSLEEPKRIRRGEVEDLSPRKSTLRHQFQMEFLRERSFEKGESIDSFQKALWCMEPRMFAVEKSSKGKRKYMVGHLGRFLDYYWRKCDPKHRHYYELIREKTPCRLYFGTFIRNQECGPCVL